MKKCQRWHDEAAFALHGLQDHSGETFRAHVGHQGLFETAEDAEVAVGVGEGQAIHFGGKGTKAVLVRGGLACQRHAQESAAVESVVEAQHGATARVLAGNLDRVLHGFDSRRQEHGLLVEVARHQTTQSLADRDILLVARDLEAGVGEALRRGSDGGSVLGVGVTDVHAANAAAEVDEDVAVDVGEGGTLGALYKQRVGQGHASSHRLRSAVDERL